MSYSKSDKKMDFFIISYIPMLAPPDPQHAYFDPKTDMDKMTPLLEDIENVDNMVDGIAWTIDFEPVFVIKHAEIIAKHIEFWSEGEVTSWFKLQWYECDGKYAMCLMPNVEKSVERHKRNYPIITGEEIPENIRYQILFKPIAFRSQDANATFYKIKDKIAKKVRVGFIQDMEQDEPYWLSDGAKFTFEYEDNEYIRSLLKEDGDEET